MTRLSEEFDGQFHLDVEASSRLVMICIGCYWHFEFPNYPSLDAVLFRARAHHTICKKEEK